MPAWKLRENFCSLQTSENLQDWPHTGYWFCGPTRISIIKRCEGVFVFTNKSVEVKGMWCSLVPTVFELVFQLVFEVPELATGIIYLILCFTSHPVADTIGMWLGKHFLSWWDQPNSCLMQKATSRSQILQQIHELNCKFMHFRITLETSSWSSCFSFSFFLALSFREGHSNVVQIE